MKTWDLSKNDSEWQILAETPRTQAGIMTIPGRGKEGGPDNRHESSDQWLYVLSGEGEACVNGTSIPLLAGSLLLIEAGDRHEIKATEPGQLRTVNFYGPPVEFDE